MCIICERYGEGTKWYYNPKIHSRNIYRQKRGEKKKEFGEDWETQHLEAMLGTIAKKWEEPEEYPKLVEAYNNPYGEVWGKGASQVMTLEETYKMIDVSQVRAAMMCVCRKVARAEEVKGEEGYTCLAVGAGLPKWERWPERYTGGLKMLSRDQAKEFEAKMNKRGFVQVVMTFAPLDRPMQIGGVCNCNYPECMFIRHRLDYGLKEDILYKGHYVAKVDLSLCNGCRQCMDRCQFHALNYNSTTYQAYIDMFSCFGCGLCEKVCPQDAIKMVEREKIPALKEEW